jgi:hypothetical protein
MCQMMLRESELFNSMPFEHLKLHVRTEPALQGAVYALHPYPHSPGGITVVRILPPKMGDELR